MNSHAIYIPKEIWSLCFSSDHRIVLSHIEYWTNTKGFCDTSKIRISEELNCGIKKTRRIIKELEKEGYIEIKTKTSAPAFWSRMEQIPYTSIIYIYKGVNND